MIITTQDLPFNSLQQLIQYKEIQIKMYLIQNIGFNKKCQILNYCHIMMFKNTGYIKRKELSKHNKQGDTQYLTLHVIELERIQYFYQQYLRTRMQKLISNTFYYYNNIGEYQISLKEKKFLRALVEKQADYLFTNCLQYYQKTQRNFGIRLDNHNKVNKMIKLVNSSSMLYRCVKARYKLICSNSCKYLKNYTCWVNVIDQIIFKRALSENDSALVSYVDIKFMVPIKSVTLI